MSQYTERLSIMFKDTKSYKNIILNGWLFDLCFTKKAFLLRSVARQKKEKKSNIMHYACKTVDELLKAELRPLLAFAP